MGRKFIRVNCPDGAPLLIKTDAPSEVRGAIAAAARASERELSEDYTLLLNPHPFYEGDWNKLPLDRIGELTLVTAGEPQLHTPTADVVQPSSLAKSESEEKPDPLENTTTHPPAHNATHSHSRSPTAVLPQPFSHSRSPTCETY